MNFPNYEPKRELADRKAAKQDEKALFEQYHRINRALIEAVCSGDEKLIKSLAGGYGKNIEEVFKRSLTLGTKHRS